MKIYFNVHLERVSCRMFGKSSSAPRRACRCPVWSRQSSLSAVNHRYSRSLWVVQSVFWRHGDIFLGSEYWCATEQQESKKTLRNGAQVYEISVRHTGTAQISVCRKSLVLSENFLRKSIGRKGSFTIKFLAGLSNRANGIWVHVRVQFLYV